MDEKPTIASATPWSNYLSSQYHDEVVKAFNTWSNVTGLKFQEVSGNTQADIAVYAGNFNFDTTRTLGHTEILYDNVTGQIQKADVAVEDPNLLALYPSNDGSYTYSSTSATLQQDLVHEIGHALGLNLGQHNDADPTSVMNSALGSNNRTLDSIDVANAQAVYGGTRGANAVAQGMDAHASQSGDVWNTMLQTNHNLI
jgi:predicted Zn-dependent protease